MKVQHYTDTPSANVEEAPGVSVRWVISDKDGAPNFAMRVFDLAPGAATPYHQHPWEHEVFILQGRGMVRGEKRNQPFDEQFVVYIAPSELHQFVNQGEGVLRFLCMIPHV